MSAAGLIVEGLFHLFGAVPTARPAQIVHTGFQLNYTTILNVIFIGVFGVLVWFYRNRDRLGGGHGYAMDPMCGMQVEKSNAPARVRHEDHTFYFCSDHCKERFLADPERHAPKGVPAR
jgi:YHS domain-containing protein